MDLKNIQTEIDASYLYKQLSIAEKDLNVAQVFAQMSDIELSHAVAFAKKFNLSADLLPKPSGRARILNKIGEIIGYDHGSI
jgi:rubrerythrin